MIAAFRQTAMSLIRLVGWHDDVISHTQVQTAVYYIETAALSTLLSYNNNNKKEAACGSVQSFPWMWYNAKTTYTAVLTHTAVVHRESQTHDRRQAKGATGTFAFTNIRFDDQSRKQMPSQLINMFRKIAVKIRY
jgi:hypothetical protein